MSPKLCAVLGALTASVGAALLFALFFTNAFVEVFIADGSNGLSCKIGFVGVYEAGFDSSCLTDEECINSQLCIPGTPGISERTYIIDAFESDTVEFKLLFPAQEEFFEEVNPLYSQTVDCIEAGEDLSCSQALLDFAFPAFTDCDEYFDKLRIGQETLFPQSQQSLDQLLFGGFAEGAALQILEPYYAGILTGGLFLTLLGIAEAAILPLGINVSLPLTTSNVTAINGVLSTVDTGSLYGSSGTVPGIDAALQTIAPSIEASCTGMDLANCFAVLTGAATDGVNNITESLITPGEYDGVWCEMMGSTAGCSTAQVAGRYVQIAGEAVQFFNQTGQSLEEVSALAAALGGLGLLIQLTSTGFMLSPGGTFNLTGSIDTSDYMGLNTAAAYGTQLAQSLTENGYPASAISGDYAPCEFLNAFGQITVNEGGILPVPASNGSCTFIVLLQNAIPIATAAESDQLNTLTGFAQLFSSCLAIPGIALNPNNCWNFFPSSLLDSTYQGFTDDDDSDVIVSYVAGTPEGEGVIFEAARKECKADEDDLEAVTKAQTLGPAGAALVVVGALVAIVAVVKPIKGVAACAGVFCLVGVVLNLVALLGVYNAPVYSVVGTSGTPEKGEVVYESGASLTLGLAGIALSAVAAVVLFSTEIVARKFSDGREVKVLGAAQVESMNF